MQRRQPRQNNLFGRRQSPPNIMSTPMPSPRAANPQNNNGIMQLNNKLMSYLMENGINFSSGDIINSTNNVLNGPTAPLIAIQTLYNKLIPYLMNYNIGIPGSVQQDIYTILNTWAIYQGQALQRGVAQTALNNGSHNDYTNCMNTLQNSGQQSVCSIFRESFNIPNDNYIDYFITHT
jgi:hypothetical protein